MKRYVGAFLALLLFFIPHVSPVPSGHVNTTTRRNESSSVVDTDSGSEKSGAERVAKILVRASLTVLRNVLQFLSGCIKREWQLRRAIRWNQNAVICPYTKIIVRRPIQITGKSFKISCRPDEQGGWFEETWFVYDCSISGKGKRGLFKGAPRDAWFDRIDVGNGTSQNGGAFELTGGLTTFSGCTFRNNKANVNGGAISITGGKVVFSWSGFSLNTALGNGGAISASGLATMVEGRIWLYGNSATNGGAFYVVNGASIVLNGVEFTRNSATNGESIFVSDSKVTLNASALVQRGSKSVYIADDGDPTGTGSFVSCTGLPTVCFQLVEFAGGIDRSQTFSNTNCFFNQTGDCRDWW